MDYISANFGPVYALLGVVLTVIVNSIIQKNKGKVDTLTSARTSLSQDQENFKNSIIFQLKECNDTVDRLHEDIVEWQAKYIEGQEHRLTSIQEIISLKQQLMQLSKRVADKEINKKEPV